MTLTVFVIDPSSLTTTLIISNGIIAFVYGISGDAVECIDIEGYVEHSGIYENTSSVVYAVDEIWG